MSGTLRVRNKLRLFTSRRWRVGLAALLPVSALLAGVLTAPAASAATFPTGWQLGMIFSPLQVSATQTACLDDWGDAQYPGAIVTSYPCNYSDAAEYWDYDTSTGLIHATDGNGQPTNYCVDVNGTIGTGNGTPVMLWPCNQNDNYQVWYNGKGKDNIFLNVASWRYLDIPDWRVSPTDGPPIQLDIWDLNGGTNQQWHFLNGPY